MKDIRTNTSDFSEDMNYVRISGDVAGCDVCRISGDYCLEIKDIRTIKSDFSEDMDYVRRSGDVAGYNVRRISGES